MPGIRLNKTKIWAWLNLYFGGTDGQKTKPFTMSGGNKRKEEKVRRESEWELLSEEEWHRKAL